MPLVVRYRKMCLAVILTGMLAPYGMSLTALAVAAQAERPLMVSLADHQHAELELPPIERGGTIMLSPPERV